MSLNPERDGWTEFWPALLQEDAAARQHELHQRLPVTERRYWCACCGLPTPHLRDGLHCPNCSALWDAGQLAPSGSDLRAANRHSGVRRRRRALRRTLRALGRLRLPLFVEGMPGE
jgi:hypothetical protein